MEGKKSFGLLGIEGVRGASGGVAEAAHGAKLKVQVGANKGLEIEAALDNTSVLKGNLKPTVILYLSLIHI